MREQDRNDVTLRKEWKTPQIQLLSGLEAEGMALTIPTATSPHRKVDWPLELTVMTRMGTYFYGSGGS